MFVNATQTNDNFNRKRYSNFFKSNTGFALTEILVALFLLVIIITSFTTLFASSYTGVFSAGHKSEALFQGQNLIENAIEDSDFVNAKVTREGEYIITLDNDDITTPVTVKGSKITVIEDYEDKIITLTSFVP
ncbi:MAG TPA: hypothetical protein DEF34_01425 [Desulfotomaculum sp.]|nr:MAG: hypothetical protein JL56_17160 [Desulfotomaculum sp. BICA1-6]HBX22286.1 hypothetical protein [Desulfotomaculum sp.]